MKKVVLSIIFLVFLANTYLGNNLVLYEPDGTRVFFEKVPERVVVLSTALVDILYALGVNIVGVVNSPLIEIMPDEIKKLQRVGSMHQPNIEVIVSLKPDLVIGSYSFKHSVKPILENMKLKSYFISITKYSDTKNAIKMLSKFFSKENLGNKILAEFNLREGKILKTVQNKKKPKVVVLFGAGNTIMMATKNSYVGEMLSLLGVKNISDKLKIAENMPGYIPINVEKIIEYDPDVILRISHGNIDATRAIFEKEFERNTALKNVKAVRERKIIDLDTHLYFANPGLKVIDALENLSRILFD
ncbi:ABC transporter substrate-binding protein [Fervidobacterium sp.]